VRYALPEIQKDGVFTDVSIATTEIDDELIEERLLEKGGVNP
jgi:hypothetical protein